MDGVSDKDIREVSRELREVLEDCSAAMLWAQLCFLAEEQRIKERTAK